MLNRHDNIWEEIYRFSISELLFIATLDLCTIMKELMSTLVLFEAYTFKSTSFIL